MFLATTTNIQARHFRRARAAPRGAFAMSRPAPPSGLPSGLPSGSRGASPSPPSPPSFPLPSLPDDVLARVFARLADDPACLARLSCVSGSWRVALARSGAWRALCHDAGRAPRRPRKPWRDIHLDRLRKRRSDVAWRHEMLFIRVTAQTKSRSRSRRASASAMRVDRPALLREAVDALALAADFDVNHRSATYGGRGLLAVAARIGAVRVAERLLAMGAAPDAADDEGWTPLMEAAFRGNERVAAALLARGARDEGFEARRYMGAAEKNNARDAGGGGGRGGGEGEEEAGEKEDGEGVVFGGGGGRREALVAGPFRASEWAAYRGNARLAAAIRSGGFGEGDKLTRTNVTPFSI